MKYFNYWWSDCDFNVISEDDLRRLILESEQEGYLKISEEYINGTSFMHAISLRPLVSSVNTEIRGASADFTSSAVLRLAYSRASTNRSFQSREEIVEFIIGKKLSPSLTTKDLLESRARF